MQLNPRAQGTVAGHRTRGLLVWSIATLLAAIALALAMVVEELSAEGKAIPGEVQVSEEALVSITL